MNIINDVLEFIKQPYIITGLFGILGIILTYLLAQRKNKAEIAKIKAETEKVKAELEGFNRIKQLDRELFSEIREILPSTGSIAFVRTHDYGGSFERSAHEELRNFLHFCESPEVEFLDPDLEETRARLENDILEFIDTVGKHTFPQVPRTDLNHITRDPRDPRADPGYRRRFVQKAMNSKEEYERELKKQLEYIYNIRKRLNRLAQQVSDTYDEFIHLGRRKLTV
jgi:Asp-tRNA(Asn)/Glu-tRNA(Gln) amidotransferase A subunit family amidase